MPNRKDQDVKRRKVGTTKERGKRRKREWLMWKECKGKFVGEEMKNERWGRIEGQPPIPVKRRVREQKKCVDILRNANMDK